MFPGPTELRLIGYSIESIWTQKSKWSTSTPKKQLADILTKGNFTRDEWNLLLCLFDISHFSSTVCSAAIAKRIQQESGEERVTAKSRPMMSLFARAPSNVSSSTSVSAWKRSYGNQNPMSTTAEKEEGPVRPDVGSDRKTAFDYLLLSWTIYGKFLLSKLLKVGWWPCLVFSRVENCYWDVRATGETRCNFLGSDTRIPTWCFLRGNSSWFEGPGRPDVDSHREARPQQFVIGNDKAELELSVESRSFVHRVNDQVRKRTETNFKCYRRWRETFYDLGNVHDCDNGISSIHGKESPEPMSIHRKYNRSHTLTDVRHIYKIGVWTRWDLWIGNNWLGEAFMEIPVIDWWRKSYQSSTHEGLRLFGFCVVPW